MPRIKATSSHGFTLVELAIVLMIIGLLIGGILKGQELIKNARITTTLNQLKSYDAATLTFMDSYGAKPGDITSPATRLPNCSTSPCNIAGDGNGMIGGLSDWTDENKNYWMHLAKANLISGVDTSATWSAPDSLVTTVYPTAPAGGSYYIYNVNINVGNATYPQGVKGNYYYIAAYNAVSDILTGSIPLTASAQMDRKVDDGKPYSGDFMVLHCTEIADGATAYPPSSTLCKAMQKTGF